jgi:hypothetical protein
MSTGWNGVSNMNNNQLRTGNNGMTKTKPVFDSRLVA